MTRGLCSPEPFTEGWIEWLQAALTRNRVDPAAAITVEHRVTGIGGGDFWWHVRLAGGRAEAGPGPAPDADHSNRVTFTSDRATARAIARGEESARRAFLEGRLRLRGDIRLLIANRPALEALSIRGA